MSVRGRPGALKRFRRVLPLFLVVLGQAGCLTTLWDRLREHERLLAVEAARGEAHRGQCEKALASLDRAQAKRQLGAYARESTVLRQRCYERLGQQELASAHRRLIADFFSPDADSTRHHPTGSVRRVVGVASEEFFPPPPAMEIASPRYSEYARRSGIVGRVVVSFRIGENGRTRDIRVLEMPHPLLATWAIEAVSRSTLDGDQASRSLPGTRFLTTYSFEWRWAK
ncbi:MAG TPA: hypothetical protein ENI85_15905 [Deltaproteobacteria bacterium]|nr:hypothetical protein [Deltaproteobacteria bacterium]